MMDGLKPDSKHDKDENNVTVAMQRITLMAPRYDGNSVKTFWV